MTDSTHNRPMLVSMEFTIRMYDIDLMGIVNNIVYIRWFEDLRSLFLETYWPLGDLVGNGLSPILSRTEAVYQAPLTIHDRPTGSLWVSEMGKARWTLGIEIATGDQIHCTGTQEGYLYDMERKRPVRLPNTLLDQYRDACTDRGLPEPGSFMP